MLFHTCLNFTIYKVGNSVMLCVNRVPIFFFQKSTKQKQLRSKQGTFSSTKITTTKNNNHLYPHRLYLLFPSFPIKQKKKKEQHYNTTRTFSTMDKDVIVKGRRKDSIEQFIGSPQLLLEHGLSQLRYMILVEGLSIPEGYDQCPYRTYVWCILSRVPPFSTENYLQLLAKSQEMLPESLSTKIKNDTFRTLMNDKKFHLKVDEESLIRILSCIGITTKVGYVQGLNVLLAPIAYVCYKSEPQAFAILRNLITTHIPLYITPNMEGVHTGLHLVDTVLKIIDPILSDYLDSKFLKAEIYALPSILTLCACTPPLKSVLKLWDFLFAYGTHMNVLFVVAQLIINRSTILESDQPMKILRTWPNLEESEIIKLSLSFIPELPKTLYDLIARHGYDKRVPGELARFLATNKM